ncbi:FadR/GntR family transcriptional regulator [Acidisoma cladoniae]|uniref:FadR/GntR family transcriptional regulator n=1 Tax=Acidisoma cladoniae TaxID=3040935 RepID=UPI00254B27C8|nr:FadR/GntR family transcriptional regulator [Acidisoma sp. PAMC 29798]
MSALATDRPAIRRPRRRSAHDIVLRGIGMAIMSGEFAVGTILPAKHDLMHRFGVSNTPLREALQTLAAKGLIVAKTKVGTRVLDQSHWNMFDAEILGWRLQAGVDRDFLARLFEMRQAFEPLAASLMAARRSDAQIARLRELLAEMVRAGTDATAFAEADVAFHFYILEASSNPFLQSIGALIRTALAASFAISAPNNDRTAESVTHAEHGAVVVAIADRDAQAAADAMIVVIRRGWTNIRGSSDAIIANIAMRDFGL